MCFCLRCLTTCVASETPKPSVSKVTAYSCHSNLLHLDISHPPRAVRLLWSLILISFPVLFSHSLLLENPFGAVI